MLNVEITDRQAKDVRVNSGTSKKTGKAYSMTLQRVYLHFPDEPYPKEAEIVVSAPYPAGRYGLDLERQAFVGAFNAVSLPSELKLQAVKQ
jgi:hypothetical protein